MGFVSRHDTLYVLRGVRLMITRTARNRNKCVLEYGYAGLSFYDCSNMDGEHRSAIDGLSTLTRHERSIFSWRMSDNTIRVTLCSEYD